VSALALHWVALLLACATLAAAIATLTARSLFALCMHLAATGALAAATLLSLRAGDGALAAALVIAVWAPVLLLGAMLLSARAAKRFPRPWTSLFAAALAGGAMLLALPDLGPAPPQMGAEAGAVGFWLAPLLLVAAAACVGVLGYGERGALQRREREL